MSKIRLNSNIVSVRWLHKHLEAENLLIFNATIPKIAANTQEESYSQILNTKFFDIKNEFSNTKSDFPNTIPTTEDFEVAAQSLGVNKDTVIVVYDDMGIYSSARVWWLFKTFGFKQVAILNGGFPEWEAKGFKTEKKNKAIPIRTLPKPKTGNYKVSYNKNNIVFFEDLEAISKNEHFKIIDARSSERFNCLVAEPRVGLRSGFIPNSINLPFNQVLNGNLLKSGIELKTIFKELTPKKQHLVFSCGSGITASILSLAATIVGYKNSVYDGSWTEYGTLIK